MRLKIPDSVTQEVYVLISDVIPVMPDLLLHQSAELFMSKTLNSGLTAYYWTVEVI
jgi:hypothetical protein